MPYSAQIPSENRYQVAAKSVPATAIGGDFYDFIQFDENTLGIFIGDVSGKGVQAALYMARLVSDFRFHTQLSRNPEEIIKTINNLLVERGRKGMFVTLQYIILDIAMGRVEIINGGHLPPAHIHAESLACTVVDQENGVPLGILADAEFPVCRLQLDHGDMLVFYTDGITEAKNNDDEQFTFERVQKFLQKKWESADDVIDGLMEGVKKFANSAPQHDDMTVVALKWC